MSHTPEHLRLPWSAVPARGKSRFIDIIDKELQDVVTCFGEYEMSKADFITLACNSHYELLEALKATVEYLEWFSKSNNSYTLGEQSFNALESLLTKSIEVLAKAEGK